MPKRGVEDEHLPNQDPFGNRRLRRRSFGRKVLLATLDTEDGTSVGMLARMEVSPEALEERMFELRGWQAD
jgi:hypothetical protein